MRVALHDDRGSVASRRVLFVLAKINVAVAKKVVDKRLSAVASYVAQLAIALCLKSSSSSPRVVVL